MCFMKTYGVQLVEDPDVTENFSMKYTFGQTHGDVRAQISTAASLFLNNQIITRVLEEAAKFGVEKRLGANEIIPAIGDRTVVVCSVAQSQWLHPGIAHPEVVHASHDVRVRGKTIVMQLKDFSFLAMWSLTFNQFNDADLRVKFGLESDKVVVYNRPEQAMMKKGA